MSNLNLSRDQQTALATIVSRISLGERESVLVGAAGTGKTTVVRVLLDLMDCPVLWAAPTGKAAARLRESTGSPAATLHSLTYRRVDSNIKLTPAEARQWAQYQKTAAAGSLPAGVPADMPKLEWYAYHCRQQGRTVSSDLSFGDVGLPESLRSRARMLVVVDEASMAGARLADDFRSVIPVTWQILWLGDKSQLKPVRSDWGVDLDNPHAELTTVHRQGDGSPILAAATSVRTGGSLPRGSGNYQTGYGSVDAAASWYVAQTTDCTVLTWRNKDRVAINNQCRLKMGHQGELRVGEKLVILANRGSVCNGEVYAVTKIEWRASRWLGMDLCFVTLTNGQEILIDHQYLLRGVQTRNLPKSAVPVDFGYCLSVHKSQGSEWDAVCIAYTWEWMSRRNPDEWRRLTYTAVTRAKDSLIVMEV